MERYGWPWSSSWMGRASMSARNITVGPSRCPLMTPTTPVPPICSLISSAPHRRNRSATNAAVPVSRRLSSGWRWTARRISMRPAFQSGGSGTRSVIPVDASERVPGHHESLRLRQRGDQYRSYGALQETYAAPSIVSGVSLNASCEPGGQFGAGRGRLHSLAKRRRTDRCHWRRPHRARLVDRLRPSRPSGCDLRSRC